MAQLKKSTQSKKRGAASSSGTSTPAAKKSKVEIADKRRTVPVTTKVAPVVESEGSDDDDWEDEGLESGGEIDEDDPDNKRSAKPAKDPQASREGHKVQKELQAQRRASKPHSALLTEAKRVWASARKIDIPRAERQKYIEELMKVLRGNVQDIVFKHDASRIVQTLVKYGGQKERDEVAAELKGKYRDLAQNKYGKFLVTKLIRYCNAHRASTLVFGVWTYPLDTLDLYEASISELQSGLEDGHFTSVDLVRAYLARIDQVNHVGPKLNAVIETNAHALEQARELDEERGLTGKRSPLHGIPILVKDSIATLASEGMNTTAGSYAFLGSVVREEATVVAKLRKAGAIILGKTNLCEWSHVRGKLPNGWSARGGQTTSPYYPRADPCGSSSGSAVAMAIGLAAGSLGAETDGSIICPAGFNNVVGIKPTVGLTSRAGVIPIAIHQDTIGPITRSVADAATILTVIAGRDERDNFTASAPTLIPDYTQFLDPSAINGKRFGVPRKVFMNETLMKFHPSVSVEFERALERIKKMGGVVVDPADFPSAEEMSFRREHWVALVQFKASLNAYIKDLAYVSARVSSLADILVFNDEHKELEEPKGYEDQSTLALAESTNGYNSTYHKFLRQNHILSREMGIDAVLKAHNLDALLLPSNLYTTLPAALAGYPMVTVPLGFHPRDTKPFPDTSDPNQVLYPTPDMPFGLSFTGAAYTEPSLIGFAHAYEQYTHTRLERRAYKEAVPTIQLGDVVGMHKGNPIVFQA